MHRCRGAEVQVQQGPAALEVLWCRDAEMQRYRVALICRGADVQKVRRVEGQETRSLTQANPGSKSRSLVLQYKHVCT